MASVTSKHLGDMVFETQVGEHKILNDVPPTPDWGGKGRYPTPPDYFVASLSSCIAAFVVQYANQAGIDTADMSVEIDYEKATKPAHLKDLAVKINLPKADVGNRLAALKRVSGQCTVHETICKMEGLPIEVRDRNATTEAA
jgi:uncharacterized OsmC-like protein